VSTGCKLRLRLRFAPITLAVDIPHNRKNIFMNHKMIRLIQLIVCLFLFLLLRSETEYISWLSGVELGEMNFLDSEQVCVNLYRLINCGPSARLKENCLP